MKYRISVEPAANRRLRRLPQLAQDQIRFRIRALANDPRPHGVVKLTGRHDTYRIRAGDYRVVYEIHDRVLLVLVIEVDHRRDVYR